MDRNKQNNLMKWKGPLRVALHMGPQMLQGNTLMGTVCWVWNLKMRLNRPRSHRLRNLKVGKICCVRGLRRQWQPCLRDICVFTKSNPVLPIVHHSYNRRSIQCFPLLSTTTKQANVTIILFEWAIFIWIEMIVDLGNQNLACTKLS